MTDEPTTNSGSVPPEVPAMNVFFYWRDGDRPAVSSNKDHVDWGSRVLEFEVETDKSRHFFFGELVSPDVPSVLGVWTVQLKDGGAVALALGEDDLPAIIFGPSAWRAVVPGTTRLAGPEDDRTETEHSAN